MFNIFALLGRGICVKSSFLSLISNRKIKRHTPDFLQGLYLYKHSCPIYQNSAYHRCYLKVNANNGVYTNY